MYKAERDWKKEGITADDHTQKQHGTIQATTVRVSHYCQQLTKMYRC